MTYHYLNIVSKLRKTVGNVASLSNFITATEGEAVNPDIVHSSPTSLSILRRNLCTPSASSFTSRRATGCPTYPKAIRIDVSTDTIIWSS